MRNFLRYGQLVIELTGKPVTIGRSSACDITIDDDLASREHCRIALEGVRVLLTDLESTNGVLVNGVRVNKTADLYHGDTVTIGTQQIVLQRQHRAPVVTPALGETRPKLSGDDDEDHSLEPTAQGDVFTILHGAAKTSLDTHDLTSAESSARSLFVAIRASIARSRPLSPGVLDNAIDLGCAMGEHTGELRWLEQILEVHTSSRTAMSDRYLARFAAMVRALGKPRKALEEYLKMCRDTGAASSLRALGSL
jgi:pSer/pThr/pTyr-binding forkhead associated (FHA) protein